jgi:hypothetical protein
MKPLLIILLFTISITAIEWGVLQIMMKNQLMKQEKNNPVDTSIPSYLQTTYMPKSAAFQKVVGTQSVKLLISRKKAKAGHHFDGRTSW